MPAFLCGESSRLRRLFVCAPALCALLFCANLAGFTPVAVAAQTPNLQASGRAQEGEWRAQAASGKSAIAPWTAGSSAMTPQKTTTLIPLSPELIDELKRQDSLREHSQPPRIGLGRVLDSPIEVSGKNAGEWKPTPDGGLVYVVHVTSPGAAGLRLHLENVALPAGAQLMVYDATVPGVQAVPIRADSVGDSAGVWLPVVAAPSVTLECWLPPGADTQTASFSVTSISHLYKPYLRAGVKGFCEIDVACHPEWLTEAAGVAMITFVEGLDTFVCTGSLINDSDPDTVINYFLTAHHCVGNQTVASTIDFYWFYQEAACGGSTLSGSYTTTSGGADLLATSSKSDFSFLRLRQDPPAGVYYLGWSISAPQPAETLVAIHHPTEDPKRISFGNPAGTLPDFWEVQWFSGVTEGGSSGSPLLNAHGLIIGQLYGGASACDNLSGIDRYGRFDITYRSIARWIDPLQQALFPFVLQQGTYSGLFFEGDHVAMESSGFITLRLKSSGAFSGTLFLGGKRSAFTGMFDSEGQATTSVNSRGATPLTIALSIDPNDDSSEIEGTVSTANWTANLTALKAVFNSRTNPCPWQGSYTLMLPGQPSAILPAGHCYASFKVDGSGNLRLKGSLADGIPFNQSVLLSNGGDWPLFGALAGGKEALLGWMLFDTNRANEDVNGGISWIRKPQPTAKYYPAGFTNEITGAGSFYQKPTNSNMQVLALASAVVEFAGGNLPSDFSDPITIAPNNKVTNNGTNRLTLSFAAPTGVFSGNVTPPDLSKGFPFHGVVLQKRNRAYGFLLGSDQTSSVLIGP